MDQNATALLQQNEMLRDIRDEIRQSRVAGNSFSGQASMVGRPSNTFLQTQHFSDRLIAGDWNNFGWTQSYKPNFKTNLSQDIMGMLGLRGAPNTMTQLQYQQLSAESLQARVASFAGTMIAPQFTGRVENLTNDIFSQSQRFARFGDPDASMFGSGVSLGAARHIARQIQTASITDMRMSGADYNTVVGNGMKMGQFDNANGADDFVRKAKEMASAVADLTRTLHMSVDEVSKSMGALRMNGITDVADQRRTMMQLGAVAQVGGLTSGEAMQAWARGSQIGGGMGISAAVSGQVNANNLAQVRGLSRGGLVPSYVMALGGGAEGIAANMSEVQMGLASSQMGRAALAGGAGDGGNFFDAMNRGMGMATRGGMSGFAGYQRSAMERMHNLRGNPDAMDNFTQGFMEENLRRMGVSDMTSDAARDMSFMLFQRNGATEATAFAMSEKMFTGRGRATSERTRYNLRAAEQGEEAQLDYDKWAQRNTFMGRFTTATKQLGEFPARLSNMLQDVGEDVVSMLPGASPLAQNQRAIDVGARSDVVSREALMRSVIAGSGRGAGRTPALEFSQQGGAAYWGGWGGWGAGGVGGTMVGAALGTMLLPGIGTYIGGALGGLAGSYLGEQAGTAAGAFFQEGGSGKLIGQNAVDYATIQKAGSVVLDDKQLAANLKKFEGKSAFKFLKGMGARGQMSADQSTEAANYIQNLARATGMSVEEVAQTVNSAGLNMNMADVIKGVDFDTEKVSANYTDTLTSLGLSNLKGVNLATTAGATALNDYLGAVGTKDEYVKAAGLKRQGMTADQISDLKETYLGKDVDITNPYGFGGGRVHRGLNDAQRQSALSSIGSRQSMGERRAGNKLFSTANAVAADILSERGKDDASLGKLGEKIRAGDIGIYDVLSSGDEKNRAALRGTFGTAEQIAQLSLSDIATLNAQDAAKKYHISSSDFKAIEEGLDSAVAKGDPSFDRNAAKRKALTMAAIGQTGAEEEKKGTAGKEAAMLNDAASALRAVCNRLGVPPVGK